VGWLSAASSWTSIDGFLLITTPHHEPEKKKEKKLGLRKKNQVNG
jgi:hypothetical protein